MTRHDALTLLGLSSVTPSEAEIAQAFDEKYQAISAQFESAESMKLKQTYKLRLQELIEAKAVVSRTAVVAWPARTTPAPAEPEAPANAAPTAAAVPTATAAPSSAAPLSSSTPAATTPTPSWAAPIASSPPIHSSSSSKFRVTPVRVAAGVAALAILALYLTAPDTPQETVAATAVTKAVAAAAATPNKLEEGEWTGSFGPPAGRKMPPGARARPFPIIVSPTGDTITVMAQGQPFTATDGKLQNGKLTFSVPDVMSCAMERQKDASFTGHCNQIGGQGSMPLKMLPPSMKGTAQYAADATPAERKEADLEDIRASLRDLMTTQEMYFANRGDSYAKVIGELPEYRPVPGVEVRILEATAVGWSAIGEKGGTSCVSYIGNVMKPYTRKGAQATRPMEPACD